MTLGERIRACRQHAKLSQEQVAELVGVSRQAVTKWETNQSAPSTENLFRLAEILGTTVDLLLTSEHTPEQSVAEQVFSMLKAEQTREKAQLRQLRKRSLLTAAGLTIFYLLLYCIGRLLFSYSNQSSVMGWLFLNPAAGPGSYLFGWLVDTHLFLFAMFLSVLPAVFGKYRFSLTAAAGFLVGLLTGMAFGPNPAGVLYGNTHYGWAIWGGIFLLFTVLGCILERFASQGTQLNSKAGKIWLMAAAAGIILIVVFVRLSIPDYSMCN